MSDHIPDVTKMIGETPRTDAAYFKPHATMYDLAGEMKLMERELNWSKERIKRLEEALAAYQKAYTPDGHIKPHDCFATGPRTGDPIQDLVVCPGCWAEQKAKEAKP